MYVIHGRTQTGSTFICLDSLTTLNSFYFQNMVPWGPLAGVWCRLCMGARWMCLVWARSGPQQFYHLGLALVQQNDYYRATRLVSYRFTKFNLFHSCHIPGNNLTSTQVNTLPHCYASENPQENGYAHTTFVQMKVPCSCFKFDSGQDCNLSMS